MKKIAVLVAFVLVLAVLFAGCAKSGDDTMTTTEADPMATYEYSSYVTVYVSNNDKVVASQFHWINASLDKILESYATYSNGELTVDGQKADSTNGQSWVVTVNGVLVDNDLSKVRVNGGDVVQFKLQGESSTEVVQNNEPIS